MTLKDLTSQHAKLMSEWKNKDLKACKASLDKMKVSLLEIQFLPTEIALESHKSELLLARDVLEIGVQHSVACADIEAYERYMAQVKTYYNDFDSVLPESVYKYELLGLNLLSLLYKNQIADFHIELETLPSDTLQNNVYIRCPVRLEQFIMEGSYNKVLMMKDCIPSASYGLFINKLLDTIREEIASCMEKAYESISIKECSKMLQLDTKPAQKFIASKNWKLGKDQVIHFNVGEKKVIDEIPTEELAKMAITYAREMEQIV